MISFKQFCLAKEEGRIGRTAIQKLACFSKEKNPDIKSTDFVPRYFGPYNQILASSLTNLVEYFYVDEFRIRNLNFTSYKYELTSDGKKNFYDEKKSYKTIKEMIDICKQYCNLNTKSLSFAAKVLHMKNSSNINKISLGDIIKKVKKLN